MILRRAVAVAVVLGVVALWPEGAVAQCAMCRRALASPEGQQMVAAFRNGIVVLLLAPFTLFATVAVLAVRDQRRRTLPADRLQKSVTCIRSRSPEHSSVKT